MADDGIGASVRRKEDYRFLTGNGHFTDDISQEERATQCRSAIPVRRSNSRHGHEDKQDGADRSRREHEE